MRINGRRQLRYSSAGLVVLALVAGCAADQQVTAIRSEAVRNDIVGADEPIPTDPATKVTVLDNGLTVYLRRNDQPGGQAEMRLVINAGSAKQADDQSGVAHFLEHMLFNGTTAYPGNKLIDTLRGFGMEFGADVNAYTSYDETVYQLTVPTDVESNLGDGVEVLAQWLSAASLDADEVEAERGVVLSEWRDRDQSFDGRQFSAAEQMYLATGSYADRAPIGNDEAINTMDVEPLRRFYDDWYRPDNAAVVIVGDVDLDDVLRLVRNEFESLEPRTAAPTPERVGLAVGPFDSPQATVVLDPDAQSGYAEIALPTVSAGATDTFGELRATVVASAAFDMIATRLTDDVSRGDGAFVDAGVSDNSFVRPLRAPYLYVSAEPDELAASIDALAVEMHRAARDGFDQIEFDCLLRTQLAGVEADFRQSSSRSDAELADDAAEAFLTGRPTPSAAATRDLLTAVYESLTVSDVSAAFTQQWSNGTPYVFMSAPDTMTDPPTQESLLGLLADLPNRDIAPREFEEEVVGELMTPPAPVVEESTKRLPQGPFLDPVQLTFPNGAVVILNQTEIVKDSVTLAATSPGGISVVPDDKVWDAFAAATVLTSGGLGDLDAVQVQQILADSTATVSPYIGEVDEGFTGNSSSADLDQLFQIVHLLMTNPRADQVALDSWISAVQPYVDDPTADPDLASSIALEQARYGNEVRYAQVPSVEQFAAVDLADMSQIFGERFSNAADWVFALSGDFSLKEATDLARRYIGTLERTGPVEEWVDRQPDAPEEPVTVDVQAGTGDKGALTLLYTAGSTDVDLDPILADLLTIVITNRLTDEIREKLGASYSPAAFVSASAVPDAIVETYVSVSGDPSGIEELSTVVRELLVGIGRSDISAGEFSDAMADLERQYSLYGNEDLANALLAAPFSIEQYETYVDAPNQLAAIELRQLQNFATRAITRRPIEVRVTPG